VALSAGTFPRSVYDCPALALAMIEPPAGVAPGRRRARRRGQPGQLRERLQADWFDLAVRDESLLPPRAARAGAGAPPRYLAALGARCAEDVAGLRRRLGVAAPADAIAAGAPDGGRLGSRPVWTMWTRLATAGASSASASLLYVVVMSPPELPGQAEAHDFERYYADRHLRQIVEEIGYLRASLFAAASLPGDRWRNEPGRYLAVYQAAGEQALHRQAARVRAMADLSFDGAPPAWASRRVAWRAAFRPMRPAAGSRRAGCREDPATWPVAGLAGRSGTPAQAVSDRLDSRAADE
jgi:hypothetical protein